MLEIVGSAIIDETGRYRYGLTRVWGSGRRVIFVMLNPSTADAEKDDPTIRRCIQFARDWGYAGLEVVNLYGMRATNPNELLLVGDPVGPANDMHIWEAVGRCDMVVCAWGSHKAVKRRRNQVLDLLHSAFINPMCLRLSKSGEPYHPLYLRSDLRPFPLPDPTTRTSA